MKMISSLILEVRENERYGQDLWSAGMHLQKPLGKSALQHQGGH